MQSSPTTRPPRARTLSKRAERVLACAGTLSLVTAAAVTGLAPTNSAASSHREAPLTSGDPKADNTDVYAFTSPDKPDTVTLVANWIPFEEPNGGPNFYPFANDARYNIKIDADGDGKPDTTYTWKFTDHVRDAANQFLYNTGVVNSVHDKTLNFRQTYTLTSTDAHGNTTTLVEDAPAAPSNVGKASMPDYAALREQAIVGLPDGGQTYAGQASDPFFLDLRIFDLLYGGNLKETGHNTLAGYNVNTIAIQVPKKSVALNGDHSRNPVIGVWSTTDRQGTAVAGAQGKGSEGTPAPRAKDVPADDGKRREDGMGHHDTGWRQVSRLGNPLVNEVVVPLKYKDAFNALTPDLDHTVTPVVDKVKDPIVPKLIQKIYGVPAPATPRNDLVEIFLTGICKACGPIKADLNSQLLNADADKKAFVPAEELRLNMAVPPTAKPNRLGVLGNDLAGFPNGRRLDDDVVDIELQALEGAAQTGKIVPALAAGDAVDTPYRQPGASFPYVALPNTAAVNQADSLHPEGGVGAGLGGTASGDGFPVLPVTVAGGGALLACAGALALRRRRAERA
ncbi:MULTISPECIES: DUF4331 domain-containing protein [unclassified Streptomyces]|uniref:DUF4331 domain-containing protein n=1 Tax=unclassified Streptomyces TaxID=2593676 RepID=UPI00081EDBC1|nr:MULTISPECIES: DUF4331 domain-containing protein [unclassified Streptomyces]MYR30587.1 DUF4331 domain-containing protein [Streptomyces sp. SID4945]SCF50185.1 protein of unknown function [Streptomyces sp. LcepLS]